MRVSYSWLQLQEFFVSVCISSAKRTDAVSLFVEIIYSWRYLDWINKHGRKNPGSWRNWHTNSEMQGEDWKVKQIVNMIYNHSCCWYHKSHLWTWNKRQRKIETFDIGLFGDCGYFPNKEKMLKCNSWPFFSFLGSLTLLNKAKEFFCPPI